MKVKLVDFTYPTRNGYKYKKEVFKDYIDTHKNDIINVNVNGSKSRIGAISHLSNEDDGLYGEYFPLETDAVNILSELEKKKIIEIEPSIEINELGNVKIKEVSIIKKRDKKNGTTCKKSN